MKIDILCSSPSHPVMPFLDSWVVDMSQHGHVISLLADKDLLNGGDILFLVSCNQIITESTRSKYKSALVLHASDLPKGRGWSPYVWSILEGDDTIVVCLIEASDPVDSGSILLKTAFVLEGHELLNEINEKLFTAELWLMTQAVERFGQLVSIPQKGAPGSYMPKRSPADSRLDPNKTIAEQFELLRVADHQRYPAFFDFRGKRFLIRIEKEEG